MSEPDTTESNREFAVTLFGATGFTGQHAVEYFAKNAPKDLPWAIAGRNKQKLEALQDQTNQAHGIKPPILVVDGNDENQVRDVAQRSVVVLSTAGPFKLYSDKLVEACASQGTHYVDITGETPWVRTVIDRFHETARNSGARIIPFCGFDSVPADIGCLLLMREFQNSGRQITQVKSAYQVRGGFNGGTLASALEMAESGDGKMLRDPLLLNPRPGVSDEQRKQQPRDRRSINYDADFDCLMAPFIMEAVNTRVVRRAVALAQSDSTPGYTKNFRYTEAMSIKSGLTGRLKAYSALAILGLADTLLKRPLGRSILRRFGPAPGEGPDQKTIDSGYTKVRLVGFDTENQKRYLEIFDKTDPGNRFTIKCLCEAALTLTQSKEKLPDDRFGVLPPSRGLGIAFAARLIAAGIQIKVGPNLNDLSDLKLS